MARSFAEAVQNDPDLLKLLSVVDKHSKDKNDTIEIADVVDLCKKIESTVENGRKFCSQRVVWSVTGRLLLGLTSSYDLHVQICFEQSKLLYENCGRRFIFEQTQTTKRKIRKRVTNETTKSNKRRSVYVEVEEQNVKRYRAFWEESLEFDPDDDLTCDSCLVPAEQITLRDNTDINETTIFEDDDQFCDGFGEGPNWNLNRDDEMEAPFFDKNMNDIELPKLDDSISFEPLIEHPEETSTPSLLAELSSIQSAIVREAVKPKSKRKRRESKAMDSETTLASDEMKKRISNLFANCKKRENVVIRDKQQFQKRQLKKIDLFSVPVINQTVNREFFAENAKIRQTTTDWTIIDDALGSSEHDQTSHNESIPLSVSEVLQSENDDRIRTRSQHRQSFTNHTFDVLPQSSTPLRPESRQSHSFQTSHNEQIPEHFERYDESEFELNDIISPPLIYQNDNSEIANVTSLLAPPIGFDNTNIESNDPSFDEDVPMDTSAIESTNWTDFIGDDVMAREMMIKLIGLWTKNVLPIKVEHLLTPRCNRFQAAKTFSLLLMLQKKKLIRMENEAEGKVAHIRIGEEFKLK